MSAKYMSKPIITILGKPNVGKSTLFNRLIGKRQSIVSHIEGVTRDRIYGEFEWLNNIYSLIDTGGFIPKSKNIIDQQVNFQAEIANMSILPLGQDYVMLLRGRGRQLHHYLFPYYLNNQR